MKRLNNFQQFHAVKTKWRFLALLAGILFLSSCGVLSNKPKTVSEGVDPRIEVTGYHTADNADYYLKEGDKVAVISPSSLPSKQQDDAVIKGLKELGYIPVAGKYAVGENRTLQQTAEDLKWALEDPEIKAIYCIRGGAAASEVIDYLGVDTIASNPKLIIGYSDISAYQAAWICQGLPSLHSSMAHTFIDLQETCADVQEHMMRGEIPSYKCEGTSFDRQGEAEGILIGGNLSVLLTAIGTEYDPTEIDQPYILFLEDTEEDIEHIHRMLTVLEHLGILDRAKGIILGEWVDIPLDHGSYDGSSRGGKFRSVADMISRQFTQELDIPVAFSFPAGHAAANYPLLMGQMARLKVEADHYTLEWK